MDLITHATVRELAETQQSPCISIYLPTHRNSRDRRQDPIRLKNLLNDADAQLRDKGLGEAEVKELLASARRLIEDTNFWKYQSDGLALFLARGTFHHYRLPLGFEELAVVTDHFHLKPLLPLIQEDGRFYLLALSQNSARVFQGSRLSLSELDVAGMPSSLAEALRFDDPEVSLQFRQKGAETGTDRAAIYHGHGAGADDRKKRLLRYFQQIDRGLQELLADQHAPLVLAAVDYYLPIYREAARHRWLLDECVSGNPEDVSIADLHTRAWQIAEKEFSRSRQEAQEKLGQALSNNKGSQALKEIVRAAHQGRVDTLFVRRDEQMWGTFDPDSMSVHVHQEQQAGDKDLLDLAALQTFLMDGTVYAVPANELPERASVAAIYRF